LFFDTVGIREKISRSLRLPHPVSCFQIRPFLDNEAEGFRKQKTEWFLRLNSVDSPHDQHSPNQAATKYRPAHRVIQLGRHQCRTRRLRCGWRLCRLAGNGRHLPRREIAQHRGRVCHSHIFRRLISRRLRNFAFHLARPAHHDGLCCGQGVRALYHRRAGPTKSSDS
jgi:hypothetical protein